MYTVIHSFLTKEKYAIPFVEEHAKIPPNSIVIFKTEETIEAGKMTATKRKLPVYHKQNYTIERVAENTDLVKIREISEKNKKAKIFCIQQIRNIGLNMNVATTDISFDEKKMEITFTAPDRVDFRELIKLLVKEFKKKIRLRQIGPRDKAKILTGNGLCGREYCCSGHMAVVPPVGMDSAREQNIAHKSPEKLSGACGKLLCCLNYEVDLYKKLKKSFPSLGTRVLAENKKGKIIGTDIINNKVRVQFEDGQYAMHNLQDVTRQTT